MPYCHLKKKNAEIRNVSTFKQHCDNTDNRYNFGHDEICSVPTGFN